MAGVEAGPTIAANVDPATAEVAVAGMLTTQFFLASWLFLLPRQHFE